MRERIRIEKTRLPEDTYAVWLRSEVVKPASRAQNKLPPDSYEVWLTKVVRKRLLQAAVRSAKGRKHSG